MTGGVNATATLQTARQAVLNNAPVVNSAPTGSVFNNEKTARATSHHRLVARVFRFFW